MFTDSNGAPSIQITIGFKRLGIVCSIGTLPHEKKTPQKIYISLSATLNSLPEDDLTTTTDYNALLALCRQTCAQCHRELIETLAQDLLDVLSERFAISHLKITIEK